MEFSTRPRERLLADSQYVHAANGDMVGCTVFQCIVHSPFAGAEVNADFGRCAGTNFAPLCLRFGPDARWANPMTFPKHRPGAGGAAKASYRDCVRGCPLERGLW